MTRHTARSLAARAQNNVWFSYNESNTVLVFLHGIFSDSSSCWTHEDPVDPARSIYWPELVRSDARFGNPSIFLAGYYTALDAGPYEVRNCADEVFRALGREDPDGRPGPLHKDRIVFVCHSTGGIVARYLLEANEASFADKEIGLVLIASPSYGDSWANRLDWLAKFYNQQLGIQLQWGSWSLRDLDARFRDLVDQRRLRIRGVEAYENHFIFHRPWLPDKKVVVTEASAGRYFGAPVLLRNTNHFTAVKPDSKYHPAHELLVDFCTRLAQDQVTGKRLRGGKSPQPASHKARQARVSRQKQKGLVLSLLVG
ncbi:MAG TPA: alpha/beta fold hydrolase [Burkholderiales bacterium]|nr:alpha/beta fold hydrolase [Burkholderiales bacterium]